MLKSCRRHCHFMVLKLTLPRCSNEEWKNKRDFWEFWPSQTIYERQCIYGQKVGIPISLECCCRFEMGITSWCKNSKPLITVNCAGWTSLLMWTCNIKFENSPIMSHKYYEKIAKFYLHSSLLPLIWRKNYDFLNYLMTLEFSLKWDFLVDFQTLWLIWACNCTEHSRWSMEIEPIF